MEDLDTSQTFLKTIDDDNEPKSDLFSDPSVSSNKCKQPEPIQVQVETSHYSDICMSCNKVVEAIHSIENKLAECHNMYAQKIEKLETTINDFKNTIESLKVESDTQELVDNVKKSV